MLWEGKVLGLFKPWIRKTKGRGHKFQAFAVLVPLSIFWVPHDGVADKIQVASDLMEAARFDLHF